MNRSEFLQRLREALENDLSGQVVQENVDYYNQYIMEEMRNGKTEEEVIEMLGDPWMLARTIIDAPGSSSKTREYTYEPQEEAYRRQEQSSGSRVHIFGIDTWWKKLGLILALVAIVCIVFAIITGVISLLAPIVIPVLLIMIIFRVIRGTQR